MHARSQSVGLIAFLLLGAWAQSQQPVSESASSKPDLQITTRAVLLDVIVTDSSGKPVAGLRRDAFTLTEEGKPQAVSYFEEHGSEPSTAAAAMPKLPPGVFTNFSPFPDPPAVNVLLLDSLNTSTENQSSVHRAALQFLKTARPGNRMAVFTMGLGLHFIQGFNDDPSVLVAALNNKKSNEVEEVGAMKAQSETFAQEKLFGMMKSASGSAEMIAALQGFIDENDLSRNVDRSHLTLENFQRLAAFLQGFPGRKNIIWFAEKPPGVFVTGSGGMGGVQSGSPILKNEIAKTLTMLATARAALYPVEARGTAANRAFSAENMIAVGSSPLKQMNEEDMERNGDQENAQIMADQSGGRAFANTNGLADIIDKISSTSRDFYTIAYTPTNKKMDGNFRKIEVKIAGGKYQLSYRRGYFAVDDALPGSSLDVRHKEVRALADKNPGQVDPLLPFMDLGMPQSQQILYEAKIEPVPVGDAKPGDPKDAKTRYAVDFAVDAKDLKLPQGPDGVRSGTLNISLIAYDRYGNVVNRKDHIVELHVKPDVWAVYMNSGVQLHAEIAVPKGNFWLRTGIYDRQSRKVGTMEVALAAVQPMQTAGATNPSAAR
jgi:VWFA-related protein